MTVEYTTQYNDLYGALEALQFKFNNLERIVDGANFQQINDFSSEDTFKIALKDFISDLSKHVESIKDKLLALDRKLGGTLL